MSEPMDTTLLDAEEFERYQKRGGVFWAGRVIGLRKQIEELKAGIETLRLVPESIEAAYFEGLHDAISDTSDERLCDLLIRRVLYHYPDACRVLAILDGKAEGSISSLRLSEVEHQRDVALARVDAVEHERDAALAQIDALTQSCQDAITLAKTEQSERIAAEAGLGRAVEAITEIHKHCPHGEAHLHYRGLLLEVGQIVDAFLSNTPATKSPRTCRVCGCTDDDCRGCIERTGAPCSWVEADLCSACVTSAKEAVI